jgi:phage-related protein
MVGGAAGALSGVMKAFTGLNKGTLTTLKDTLMGFAGAAQGAMGLDKILDLSAILKPILDILKPFATIINLFTKGISIGLLPALQQIMQKVLSPENIERAIRIGTVIGEMIVPVIDFFLKGLKDMEPIFKAGAALFKMLMNNIAKASAVFAPFIKKLADMLIPFIVELIDKISVILDDIFPVIMQALEDMMPTIEKLITYMMEAIMDILPDLIEFFVKLIPVIIEVTRVILELWMAFKPLLDILIDVIMYGVNALSKALTWLMESGTFDKIIKGIEMFAKGIEWLAGGLRITFGAIHSVFRGFIDGVIGIVNWFIDAFNTVLPADKKKSHIGTPTGGPGPYLAVGGTIEKSGPAMVHAGEIVLNPEMLGALTRAITNTMVNVAAPIGGPQKVFNITVQTVYGEDIATDVARKIYKQGFLVE